MIQAINLLFLGYVIIWPLFSATVFQIDGAGRIYMMLSALVMLINLPNSKFRKILKLPVCWTWLLWVIYTIFNKFRAGIPPMDNTPMFSYIFVYLILPFLSLWVASYEMQTRPKILLKTLLTIFVVYLLWGLLIVSAIPVDVDRGSGVLGNEFALATLSIITVACLCFNYSLIKASTLFIVLACSIAAIFFMATRKALVGAIIILCFFYISRNLKFTFFNFLKIGVMLAVLYFASIYVMENTLIGERFLSIEDDADAFNSTNSALLSFLGDRAYFYIEGWDLFLKNPFFGIGIDNFRSVTNYPMPIHSEYIVQLAENGIAGTILYIMFICSTFISSIKIQEISLRGIALGWLFCVLFISLTSWTYDMPLFFIIFGLIITIQKQDRL